MSRVYDLVSLQGVAVAPTVAVTVAAAAAVVSCGRGYCACRS